MKQYTMQTMFILLFIFLTISLGCNPENPAGTENINIYPSVIPPADTGEAYVWFLGHCGFAVQIKNAFLIFDYVEQVPNSSAPVPADPSVWSGYIVPEEINSLNVHVFVTHEHSDHYDPVIFGWENSVTDIHYYFGWQASNHPDHHCLILLHYCIFAVLQCVG